MDRSFADIPINQVDMGVCRDPVRVGGIEYQMFVNKTDFFLINPVRVIYYKLSPIHFLTCTFIISEYFYTLINYQDE